MNEEHTAIDDAFDSIDDAVAAWVAEAGGVTPRNVWLAPKQRLSVKLPASYVPQILVSRLIKDRSTGQYMARAMNWPFLLKMSTLSGRLGLPISNQTLRRLIFAGFVRGILISPGLWLVDVESLHEHMLATSGADGDLFWTHDRLKRYNEAVARDRRGTNRRGKDKSPSN